MEDDTETQEGGEVAHTTSAAEKTVGRRKSLEVKGMAWNTPFPPAEFFASFNGDIKNGSNRLFNHFIEEGEHRRHMQRRAQIYPFIIQLFARSCALIFSLAALGVVIYAVHAGAYWIAGIFGSGMLVAVVSAFLKFYPDQK